MVVKSIRGVKLISGGVSWCCIVAADWFLQHRMIAMSSVRLILRVQRAFIRNMAGNLGNRTLASSQFVLVFTALPGLPAFRKKTRLQAIKK